MVAIIRDAIRYYFLFGFRKKKIDLNFKTSNAFLRIIFKIIRENIHSHVLCM